MVRRTEEQDYFFDCEGALGLTATDRGKKQATKIQKNDALKPKGMNDKTKVENAGVHARPGKLTVFRL